MAINRLVYHNVSTKETAMTAKTPTTNRTFRVKYDNWPVRDTNVVTSALDKLDDDGVARKVMGTAFEQHLKGEWPNAKGRVIVLVKAGDGLWEGTRTRGDGRVQEWYIMETTAN